MPKCEKCNDMGWEWVDTSWGSKTVRCSAGCVDPEEADTEEVNNKE